MANSLGELQLEFSANFDKLNRDLERAKADGLKFALELERNYQISPSFNTQELAKAAKSAGTISGKSFSNQKPTY